MSAAPVLGEQVRLERARRALEVGEAAEAVALLEPWAASPEALTLLGIAYTRTYRIDRALDVLVRAVEEAPEAFAPRATLGELYLRLGVVGRGREELTRSLRSAKTPAERERVGRLLADDRIRGRNRMDRPAFHRPFFGR
jgi:predicted Zn-dependent protease